MNGSGVPSVNCKTFEHDSSGVSVHYDDEIAMFVLRDDARRLFHQSYESSGRVGGDKYIQFSIQVSALRELLRAIDNGGQE